MLMPVLRFELKYHFSQTLFRIALFIFFLLGLISVGGGFGADVHKNSPYVIMNITGLLSLCTIFSATLFAANVVLRDKTYRLDAILFSTSIKKIPYFISRFTGLFTAVFLTLIVTSIGMMVGCFFTPSAELGSPNLSYSLYALVAIGFPNVLICCSVIFCAAMLTNNIRAVYAAGVLLYVLYWAGSILGNSPLLATSDPTAVPGDLSMMADPFALSVFFSETKQWTVQQKNEMLLPLEGTFLANRLIWLCVSAFVLYLTFRAFRFQLKMSGSARRSSAADDPLLIIPYKTIAVTSNGYGYVWRSFISQLKLESAALFRHIPFMVMMILWIFMYTVEMKDTLFGGIYSIRSYPDTSRMLEEFAVVRPMMILIIFYAAELIWRERSSNIQSLFYSTPVRNIVPWAAKLGCLVILIAVVITTNIGISIGLQLFNGYSQINLPDYIQLYYYSGFPLLLFAVLTMFIMTIIPNKYISVLAGAVIAALIIFSNRIGIEHYLFRFASTPEMFNSSMNGFGHYEASFNWYMLYWFGFAIILSYFSILFWQNSRQQKAGQRIRLASSQIGIPGKIAALLGLLICFGAGYWIYQQTNVIGGYKNRQDQLEWQAGYEKKYKTMAASSQPVIQQVKTEIALYPDEQRYTVNGSYIVKNESVNDIKQLWIGIDPEVTNASISIQQKNQAKHDQVFDQYIYELDQVLKPGQQLSILFSLDINRSGFTAFNNENSVVSNGSYIELEKYLPYFGYNDRYEISSRSSRARNGLPENSANLPADTSYHYVDYETTVSTNSGQQVVTVGELQRTWEKDGRSFFHFKTSTPVPFMFALSSANYLIRKADHKGVELKVYYHEGHEANLSSMIEGVKDALDYCSENFTPYNGKTLSIAEIPQYRGAATAYPGVLFSAERINFTSDYRDSSRVDQSYAIAVHETAHEWWAIKLQPSASRGNKVLTESMAKYVENAVLRKRFGIMHTRSYLQDDNQLYNTYRSMTENEQAMDTVVGQPFVYYQKGGLEMFALQESMGEQTVNTVLRSLLNDYGYPKRKANVEQLCERMKEKASPMQAKLVDDIFKRVITWDISVDSAAFKPLPDGRFEVICKINAAKYDGPFHTLKSVPLNDSVTVAIFDREPAQLNRRSIPVYTERVLLNKNDQQLRFNLNFKPVAIWVDPFVSLIGDEPGDNVKSFKGK